MRSWLRVPDALRLPAWVRVKLGNTVSEQDRASRGLDLDSVVFGIVDLETTGLSSRDCLILEIGLVVMRGRQILRRYETLVDIGVPIPSAIVGLTGIEDSQLVDAPSEIQALAGLARVLEQTGVDVLVAHNARFDRGFLQAAWERHRLSPPLPRFLCSVKVARRLVRAPSYRLGALVEQLGIPRRPSHRALGDAEMTSELWRELLQRARLEEIRTLEALVEWEARPRRSRSRRSEPAAAQPDRKHLDAGSGLR